jgi:predicted RNA-binding Zn ribbon-like protein
MADLPEELALPLSSGAPYWYWLGGRPALDFVNTRRERWRRRVETLVTPRDLGRWLAEARLTDGEPRVTRDLLADARELREAIDEAVQCAIAGTPVRRGPIVAIDLWLPRPRLARGGDGMPLLAADGDPARRALGAIALDAATMLGSGRERARLRICASETCSARFYDRSPAGRRRWCSMQACGNVDKVRRHRARQSLETTELTT